MAKAFLVKDEDETQQIAKCILPHLKPADCLLLRGSVGAGKSSFARSLIGEQMRRDGIHEDIPSPTFTLQQIYPTSRGSFCHMDLYRLGDASELYEIGIPEIFEDSITLIEWPERLGHLRPKRAMEIVIELQPLETARKISLLPSGPGWDWIDQLDPFLQES